MLPILAGHPCQRQANQLVDFRASSRKVFLPTAQAGACLAEAACCSKLRRWTKGYRALRRAARAGAKVREELGRRTHLFLRGPSCPPHVKVLTQGHRGPPHLWTSRLATVASFVSFFVGRRCGYPPGCSVGLRETMAPCLGPMAKILGGRSPLRARIRGYSFFSISFRRDPLFVSFC